MSLQKAINAANVELGKQCLSELRSAGFDVAAIPHGSFYSLRVGPTRDDVTQSVPNRPASQRVANILQHHSRLVIEALLSEKGE